MKVKKLDARMSGHGNFKFYVNFMWKQGREFSEIRKWCWEQWGASSELEFWQDGDSPWCWMNDSSRIRLLFQTEKETQWFLLKWGN
jgi:hypothetical protein